MKTSYYSLLLILCASLSLHARQKPNVIIIYADDLGYGDLSCYGSKIIATPNIDRLAIEGIRFSNAHATSPTCTPSRYAMITGMYPWRQEGVQILPGDAPLIVPVDKITLPKVFKNAGYSTALVGKWHLGLGSSVKKDWNADISPGPNEVGFDYSYIFPATADRVPTVFLENHKVVASDNADPIVVSYTKKVGSEPTGRENPELLRVKSSQGHDNTIINGIGRIGYMSGGHKARWTDEELTYTFVDKARQFISQHTAGPFMLCYHATEPHVPRMPATAFRGKSGLGYRGDAILQLDWTVGEIMRAVRENKLENNTLIILTSDNGPVLDDGYVDGASELYQGEQLGGLRGGKYSLLEGGTREPFIAYWKGKIRPGVSDALICQIDLLRSFATLLKQQIPLAEASDSEDIADALLGKSSKGRQSLVKGNTRDRLSLISGSWKYIPPYSGPAFMSDVSIETGYSLNPQLYQLQNDLSEQNNVAEQYPDRVKQLNSQLLKIVGDK